MCSAANILVAFPKIVQGLNGAMDAVNALAAGKFLTTQADNTKIAARYKGWFEWVAYFVRTAIIEPASKMGDVQQLAVTAKIVQYAEKILTATPRIIVGLGKAMDELNNLADEKFMKSAADNTRIANNYKGWFEWVSYFVRVAIMEPVKNEFKDIKQLQKAARILSAMSTIVRAIPVVIKNLATAMGLMSGSTKYMDDDFPMDKIMLYKDRFQDMFTKIAKFMLEGIVNPVVKEIKDPKEIMKAARILSAMGVIIRAVPPIIKNLATAMGMFSGSEEHMDADFPMDKIMLYKDRFQTWFRGIAKFMLEGIVDPILTEIPDSKTIMMAGRILSAMGVVVRGLPNLIRTLSSLFGPLNPRDCLADSPISVLAAGIEQFKGWFRSITSFLREGIIWPIIDSMPTDEEVLEAETKLAGMKDTVTKTTGMLDAFSSQIGPLTEGWWWFSPIASIGGKVAKFAGYWDGISSMLNQGIIEPIKKNLPPSKEIEEAAARINALADVLLGVKTALELLSEVMMDIQGMGLDMNALKTLPLAELMAIGSGTMSQANGAAGKGSAMEVTASVERMPTPTTATTRLTVANAASSTRGTGTDAARTGGPLSALTNPSVVSPVRPAMERGTVRPAVEMPSNVTNPAERIQRMSQRASRTANDEINPYTQRRDRNAARRAASRGSEVQSIESAHQRITEENRRASGSAGAETTPLATPQARTIPPNTDVHAEVRQNAAGRKPATSQVTSPELAQIVSASNEEVDQQKQMVSLLEEMLKLFKGGNSQAGNSGGRGPGDTAPNNIQQKPNNYYRWPTGNQFQQGAKQVLNVGAGIV